MSTIGLTRFFAALGVTGALLAGCDTAPRTMAPVDKWGAEISEASRRFNVPEPWIRAVMAQESGGRTHWSDGTPIVSHAGAMGLMQVMPGTWDELAEQYGLGDDPNNPRDNIMAGTAYIRQMYDLYGNPGFLGAYNAGPGRYGQYVSNGRTLPTETQRYMEIIGPQIAGIYPDDSHSPMMDQYAEAAVARTVTPATTRMAPIPDGSSAPIVAGITTMAPVASAGDELAALPPVVTPASIARTAPVGALTTMAPIVNPEDQLAEYTGAVGGSTVAAAPPVTVVPAAPPVAADSTAAILSEMANNAPVAAPVPARIVASTALPPVTVPPPPAVDPTSPGSDGLPPGWFVPTAPVRP